MNHLFFVFADTFFVFARKNLRLTLRSLCFMVQAVTIQSKHHGAILRPFFFRNHLHFFRDAEKSETNASFSPHLCIADKRQSGFVPMVFEK